MLARLIALVVLATPASSLAQEEQPVWPPSARQQQQPAQPAEEAPPAEEPPPATEPAETEPTAQPAEEEELQRLGDEQVLTEERLGTEQARSDTDPWEDPQQPYWFFGAFYRQSMVPAFIVELFVDLSPAAFNPQVGAEFTYRKDGFDITTSVYWARFFANGAFRASGDPVEDTEILDVNLHFIGAGVTFLWSTEFNDIVAFQYGVGLGIGGVAGDLIRTEAYPQADGSGWEICEGALNPMSQSRYCAEINEAERHRGSVAAMDPDRTNLDGADGEHYNIKARRWSGGGSVPNVWFRAALPHLALRIKPIHQLMMRVDFGFDLFSGFFVGFAANFGF